jgi:hypothetical protein
MAALNTICPNCGLVIANAVITAQNTIQCRACRGTFVVKVRPSSRMSAVADAPVEPAAPPAEVDDEPVEDASQHETKSYSSAQLAALVYDRPERVPLGPLPEVLPYRMLAVVGWAALVLAIIYSAATFYSAVQVWQAAPDSAEWPILSALLNAATIVLAGVVTLHAAERVRRVDFKANWIAWRSAALEEPLGVPADSVLPMSIPFFIAGLSLIIFGIRIAGQQDESGSVAFLGGAMLISAVGVLLLLTGLAAKEVNVFLWRMAQIGRFLPFRKRGDEIALGYPMRVHGAPEPTSSPFLIVLAFAFLAATYATVIWFMFHQLAETRTQRFHLGMPIAESGLTTRNVLGLALGGFIGIAGGAYTVYRLATLWGEMSQTWETAGRSIRKPRGPFFGEKLTRALRLACWIMTGAIVCAIVPVVRNVGHTSIHVLLFSILIPSFTILFILWLGALKNDSFNFIKATSVVSSSPFTVAGDGRRLKFIAVSLAALAAAKGTWLLCKSFMYMYALWSASGSLREPNTAKAVSVELLSGVVLFSLHVLPACWAALMLLDLDRAAANLEACEEVPDARPQASSSRRLIPE